MSLATFTGVAPSLHELVEGIASRTGAWVVVEKFGAVVTHGAGRTECPPPVARSLVTKRTEHLRAAVTWSRGRGPHLCGDVAGVSLTAFELGDGVTAWFVGAVPEEGVLPLLAAAALGEERPVIDPVVEDLLHPRGPHRGQAPQSVLVALRHDGAPSALSRRAASIVAGTAARVHAEGDLVFVALPLGGDPRALHDLLSAACAGVVAGVAAVKQGASDWVAAAHLAAAACRVATQLGQPLGILSDPAVAAELVVAEAHEAVYDLVRTLPEPPLRKLEEHDARSCGELVNSLRAWCRAGFDVPTAAATMHVHPNTLRYRLRRATEICGLDITQPRQLLALQLLLEV